MSNFPSVGRCAAVAVAIAVMSSVASGQTYPSRVIKIIVPFGAGGQPDTIARVFAQHLAGTVGATLIDNRPGGNTTIGAKAAASAEPDGYTLFFGTSTSLAIAPALTPNAGYDPVKSFAPIVGVSSSPMYLTVGPSVKAKTVAELIEQAKANPGKLNFAAPTGGPPHLSGEMFKRATGIDITPIFYRTMNQAFTDMLASQMDIIFEFACPVGAVAARRQDQGAGGAQRKADGRIARRADDGGERVAGLARDHMERAGGAGRHPAGHHRQAQRRYQ